MANIEKLIPHLFRWEAGIIGHSTNKELFEAAKKTGWSNDRGDIGGATMIGVTISTYEQFCKHKNYPDPTPNMLKNIPYEQWSSIVKTMYWDRWNADKIKNQSIANILVDWVWCSGTYGITIPQRILCVQTDGIVGTKTLLAVNSENQEALFNQIVTARKTFIDDIIKNRPANAKFRNGWMNRINSLKFEI